MTYFTVGGLVFLFLAMLVEGAIFLALIHNVQDDYVELDKRYRTLRKRVEDLEEMPKPLTNWMLK